MVNWQIGVKGAQYLAEALQYNSTISTLDLRANSLGDDVSNNPVSFLLPLYGFEGSVSQNSCDRVQLRWHEV